MILRGKNIAGGPAQISAQSMQGFYEHGRLNGHMQGAGNPQTLKRLCPSMFIHQLHKPRHFIFSKLHFLVPEISQSHIRHFMGQGKVKGGSVFFRGHDISP
jgi:hypothetical protein